MPPVKPYNGTEKFVIIWDKGLRFPSGTLLLVNRISNCPYITVRTRKVMRSFGKWVMERTENTKFSDGEEAHHINLNPLDNRYGNLLRVTVKKHTALHSALDNGQYKKYGMLVNKALKEGHRSPRHLEWKWEKLIGAAIDDKSTKEVVSQFLIVHDKDSRPISR